MNPTYEYRQGLRISSKVSAQVVGEELERIRLANGGKLKPEDVVMAATDEDSPLHRAIPYWDDQEAAHLWRVSYARQLIRSIRVVNETRATTDPAFVNVRIEYRDQYYQSSEVLVHSMGEFAAALRGSKIKLEAAHRSFEDLQRLATGVHADDRLALISVVMESLATARSAVEKLQ